MRALSILVLNQTWFVDQLRELGHRVVTAGQMNKAFDLKWKQFGYPFEHLLKNLPRGFEPDCLLYLDDSGPVTLSGLENFGKPMLYYSVDAHHHAWWHSRFSCIFDAVLVAHRDYISEFEELHDRVDWMPLWAPQILKPEKEKTIDVCFRGNLNPDLHPQRVKFLEALQERVAVDSKTASYLKDFPVAKIVLNQAVKRDLNFRTFEAMGSGALLLNPDIPNGLTELFVPGHDLVLYKDNDPDDAAQKIRYYLEHEEERQRIAESGYQKVCELHTEASRAKQIESLLLDLKVGPRSKRYWGAAAAYLRCARRAGDSYKHLLKEYLACALESILCSATTEKVSGFPFVNVALGIAFELERISFADESLDLLRRLHEHRPNESVLALCYFVALTDAGEVEKAATFAERVSSKPKEFMRAAPEMVANLKKQIAKSQSGSSKNVG